MRLTTALLMSLIAGSACGQTITVDDDLVEIPNADYTSITDALAAATDGDTIIVAPGTYTGVHNIPDISLSIEALDPAFVESTIIDGLGTRKCFDISISGSNVIRISGLTITNAYAPDVRGSALRAFSPSYTGARVELTDCVFSHSAGNRAVNLYSVDVTMRRCVFQHLESDSGDSSSAIGAVAVTGPPSADGVTCIIEDCIFENNTGCGLELEQIDDVTISRCEFVSNTLEQPFEFGGGGVSIQHCDSMLSDCLFQDNHFVQTNSSKAGFGGGLYIVNGNTLVERCRFLANRTRGSNTSSIGGGIAFVDDTLQSGILTVTDSVFIGNSARCGQSGLAQGGAIGLVSGCEAIIINCSFDSNSAFSQSTTSSTLGAGICFGPDTVGKVVNSIVRRNRLETPNDSVLTSSVQIQSWPSASYSRVNTQINNAPGYVRMPNDGGDGWGDGRSTNGVNEGDNDDFGDLNLTRTAASVNAGSDNDAVSSIDAQGRQRIIAQSVDRGAYESGWGNFYIDHSADGTGSGASWANAARSPEDLLHLPLGGNMFVAEGTYTPSTPDRPFLISSELDITGGYPSGGGASNPQAHPTIFSGDLNGDDMPDGSNRADNAEHVFHVISPADSRFSSLTIRGGNAPASGGGILVENAILRLSDVTIEECDAGDQGGALASYDSDIRIERSILKNNSAAMGSGALHASGGVALLFESKFDGNSTPESTGAVHFSGGTYAEIVDCDFYNNSAGNHVGAVAIAGTDTYAEIANTTFRDNSASARISAIRISDGASCILGQSLIYDNTSDLQGAVRAQGGSSLTIAQSTIANNTSANSVVGGVQTTNDSSLTLSDTIIAGNTGSNMTSSSAAQINGSFTGGFNIIQGWAGDPSLAFDADPAFSDPSGGDYSLSQGSAAIDAGHGMAWFDYFDHIDFDFAGESRIVNDRGTPDTGIVLPDEENVVDIGAYEFQGTTPGGCLADTNNDAIVNPADFTTWINAYNNNLPACDQNLDGTCTPTDFTAWITNYNAGCG